MDNLPGTIRLSTERMIVMGQNLRIKLTKLIEKLPEAAVSSLLEQAESYKTTQAEAGRPACPDHIRAENYGKKSYPIL